MPTVRGTSLAESLLLFLPEGWIKPLLTLEGCLSCLSSLGRWKLSSERWPVGGRFLIQLIMIFQPILMLLRNSKSTVRKKNKTPKSLQAVVRTSDTTFASPKLSAIFVVFKDFLFRMSKIKPARKETREKTLLLLSASEGQRGLGS